ncbi:lytic transglycosylase domain-containing protein, partial [Streptomyces alkaliphilus]|uniref:lytic transglycosylase domain-containing protein n=1 Tax=Streptomyces alkaliphilus TaxID=1472722 RepID=UPI003F665DAB
MASTRRRIRRGLSGSALAAVAMAALTASQGTDLLAGAEAADGAGGTGGGNDYPGRPYETELPPLGAPAPDTDPADREGTGPGPDGLPAGPIGEAAAGIPAAVLEAYRAAEASLAVSHPGCGLEWELLAAIGKVESGHARGGALDAEGNAMPPILGPVLDGNGFARITDTDGGRWDGDAVFDRAVGPMQFIPSTWAGWGADGNGDGVSDPNNVYDATLAAGHYLCAGSRDLSRPADLDRALLSYNNSREYVNTVMSWLEYYREGVHAVPDAGPGAGGNSGNPGGAGVG